MKIWRILLAAAVVLVLGSALVWHRYAEGDALERLQPIKAKVESDFPGVRQIGTDELYRRFGAATVEGEPKPLLLDVRRADEFEVSHLEGAIRIDPDSGPDDLPAEVVTALDSGREIIAYCSVGYRSSRLVDRLVARGHAGVSNLEGSIFEWVAKGYPLVDAHGPVDRVHPYGQAWAFLVDEEHRAFEPRAEAGHPGASTADAEALEFEPASEAVAALYAEAGVEGTFVLLVPGEGDRPDRWIVHDAARAEQRFVPASTFKIPNSLITLETGVSSGPDFALEWDGVERPVKPWNRDHVMRTAIRYSVLWFYQEMARRVGAEEMARRVAELDYGNGSIEGGIDRFWLDGELRISAVEQVRFLRRLEAGTLPYSERSMAIVREILELEREGGHVLRAKTGWALGRPLDSAEAEGEPDTAWLVGWVEREGQDGATEIALFAHNISFRDRAKAKYRTETARAVLRHFGWLPE